LEKTKSDGYQQRLESHGNTGVLLGPRGNGICTIDCDDDDTVKTMLRLNPRFKDTLQTRARRGCNFWLRLQGDYPHTTKFKWGEWRAGDRNGGGSQTVIRGVHPEGCEYIIVNRASPISCKFEDIQWPDGTDFQELPVSPVKEKTTSKTNLCSTIRPQDLGEALLIGDNRLSQWKENNPELGRLWDCHVTRYFKPGPKKRNAFIQEVVPVLFYRLAPGVIEQFSHLYRECFAELCHDPMDQHMAETQAMILNLEKTFFDELVDQEKRIYERLPHEVKPAFRILRDLAMRDDCDGTFFMDYRQLQNRLGLEHPPQAQRLLKDKLVRWGIVQQVDCGSARKAGERGRASTWKWCRTVSNLKRRSTQ
jgi:hypothetical protein